MANSKRFFSGNDELDDEEFLKFTSFNQVATVDVTAQIEFSSTFDFNQTRLRKSTSGSGSFTDNPSDYELSVSSASGDRAEVRTAEIGKYIPGYECLWGLGWYLDSAPGPNQVVRLGYFDTDDSNNPTDGYFLEITDSSMSFVIIKGGTRVSDVDSSDWKVDPLGDDVDFKFTDATIIRVPFTWYGAGDADVEFFIELGKGYSELERFHVGTGERDSVLTEEINLPLEASIENTGSASANSLHVLSGQFHVRGNNVPQKRVSRSQHYDLSSSIGSSDWTPLVAFKHQAGKENVPVELSQLSARAANNMIVEAVTVPSLNDITADDSNPIEESDFSVNPGLVADETAIEEATNIQSVDESAIIKRLALVDVAGGQGNQVGSSAMSSFAGEQIAPLDIVVLRAKAESGTSNNIKSVFYSVEEKW